MKLAIMQPYFLPYIGYWQLIYAVDKFVIYDDVNYIKGGWINRNNILAGSKKQLFTIKLKGASSFKLINQTDILDDFIKFRKTIQTNYAKAPYFSRVMKLVTEILDFDGENLAAFLRNSIELVAEYVGINTELLISSDIKKDPTLKAQDRVIDICTGLGAAEYYNAIGGTGLYSPEDFRAKGIDLKFMKTSFTPYKQFKNEFVPGLSIIDIMMFNDVEAIQKMLGEYTLV
ncbi:MAG: WbqC family protein [Clostridiales Family XIII bacterium]|jgi:hypothetical protein|nr:WbqC family protein [Clostridiales Family XIII bacterium]